MELRARLPTVRLPHGRLHVVGQLLLFLGADLLYELVRGLVAGAGGPALAHAHAIAHFEQAHGFFLEPRLQHAILGHPWLVTGSNWAYMNVQFTFNAGFLAILYLFRPRAYTVVRDAFFAAMALALAIHLALPVAPPRMLPQLGFVDTIRTVAHVDQDSGAIGAMVNPYAAVPSMHMCFALLIGGAGYLLARRTWLRVLAVAYPVLVLAIIVVTANHFFLDAAAGAAVAGVAVVAARRRRAWTQRRVALAPS